MSILSFTLFLVFLASVAIQASVQISRDIAVNTVNELTLKSQVDDNIICADKRFKPIFDAKIRARPAAFIYKEDPQDFMPYSFILSQESITDCSTLLIYESTFTMIPPQFS